MTNILLCGCNGKMVRFVTACVAPPSSSFLYGRVDGVLLNEKNA